MKSMGGRSPKATRARQWIARGTTVIGLVALSACAGTAAPVSTTASPSAAVTDPAPAVSDPTAAPTSARASGPESIETGAITGVVTTVAGDFDFVLFEDGSYYFEGPIDNYGARQFDAYNAADATSVTYVEATDVLSVFAFERQGVPATGALAHHGMLMYELGLQWVSGIFVAELAGTSSGAPVSGVVSAVPGIHDRVAVANYEGDGEDRVIVTSLAVSEPSAYAGPSIADLMSRIPTVADPEIIQWGYVSVAPGDWETYPVAAVLEASSPNGFAVTSVFTEQGAGSGAVIVTLRNGFETVTIEDVPGDDGDRVESIAGHIGGEYPGVDVEVAATEGPRAGTSYVVSSNANVGAQVTLTMGDRVVAITGNTDPRVLASVAGAVEEAYGL